MAIKSKPDARQRFFDKESLRKILEETDARSGFVYDPTATPEEVRALMRAQGIRPEDNILSREIIRARYEEEE